MEIYDGNQWTGILATSPELQTGGTRGMQFGGKAPSFTNRIFKCRINWKRSEILEIYHQTECFVVQLHLEQELFAGGYSGEQLI